MPNAAHRSLAAFLTAWLCFSGNLVSLQANLLAASVEHDQTIPQLQFAAQEIVDALKETGKHHLQVTLSIKPDKSSAESFEIRTNGQNQVEVIGSDASGAMKDPLNLSSPEANTSPFMAPSMASQPSCGRWASTGNSGMFAFGRWQHRCVSNRGPF